MRQLSGHVCVYSSVQHMYIPLCVYTQPGNWQSDLKNAVDFEEFMQTGDETYSFPDLDERSAVALCYTSGTTGDPKGVAYSHRSTYLHTLYCMATDVFALSGADCVLPYVPMFHALAWCTPFTALACMLYECSFFVFTLHHVCTMYVCMCNDMHSGLQAMFVELLSHA